MNPIMKIANKYNLIIIEDACEAIGAEYNDKRIGTFGLASTFAFYPNKQMTTAEGGIIVTDNKMFVEILYVLNTYFFKRSFFEIYKKSFHEVGICFY